MIRYKVDVLALLKSKGYSTYRIQREGLINNAAYQKLLHGKLIAWEQLNRICNLLKCDIGEILEFIPDTDNNTDSE